MTITYLINQYPHPGQTFIRREVGHRVVYPILRIIRAT